MGWTYHYNIPRNERAEIEALCTFENEDRACRPIRTSQLSLPSGIWRWWFS